jgi:hypothetical protein
MPFLLLRVQVRVQHPVRYRGKHDDENAMPALHTGFAFGQDTFDSLLGEARKLIYNLSSGRLAADSYTKSKKSQIEPPIKFR